MAKNEKGFSLIEVMIAAAAAAGLSLVITKVSEDGFKAKNTAESGLAKVTLQSQISQIMSSPNGCAVNLGWRRIWGDPAQPAAQYMSTGDPDQGFFLPDRTVPISFPLSAAPPSPRSNNSLLVIGNNYSQGSAASTWTFLGYTLQNKTTGLGGLPVAPVATPTTGFLDLKFYFRRLAGAKVYGTSDVVIPMQVSVTAIADGFPGVWRITNCGGVTFSPDTMCSILGGQFIDASPLGSYDVNDRCVNIAGFYGKNPTFDPNSFNTILGTNSGRAISTGLRNTHLGYQAGSGINAAPAATGSDNISVGYQALGRLTSGNNNIGIGSSSLASNLTGTDNIGIGFRALINSTSSGGNIGIGSLSLEAASGANNNVGIGLRTLNRVALGVNNVAIGSDALTTGDSSYNIAIGGNALRLLPTFSVGQNTAIGFSALSRATSGVNIAIGHQNSDQLTNGNDNVSIGNRVGVSNGITTGDGNVAVGFGAGNAIGDGNFHTFVGTHAGEMTNGSGVVDNTGIGYHALYSNRNGNWNTAVGTYAIERIAFGAHSKNTSVGSWSGQNLNSGSENTFLGVASGRNLGSGSSNTFIGHAAGETYPSGDHNIIIGNFAGLNSSGSHNIIIGDFAASGMPATNNRLYIGHTDRPLISGQLQNSPDIRAVLLGNVPQYGIDTDSSHNIYSVRGFGHHVIEGAQWIKGSVAIPPLWALFFALLDGILVTDIGLTVDKAAVFGDSTLTMGGAYVHKSAVFGDKIFALKDIDVTGNYLKNGNPYPPSDVKLKSNIHKFDPDDSLKKILSLNGISFDWKDEKLKEKEGIQFGVIAQEVQKVFPELIHKHDKKDYLMVNYDGLFAPIISSIKGLDNKIEPVLEENKKMKVKIEKLEMQIAELKRLVELQLVKKPKD